MGKKNKKTITVDSARSKAIVDKPITMGLTGDSYANIAAKLGLTQPNLTAGGTYDFNPISRNRILLEQAHRGSWIVRQAVDIIPDEMTRAGIEINCDDPPDDLDRIYQQINNLRIWRETNRGLRWAKLYGGSALVLLIKDQPLDTPFDINTVGKDQFKGVKAIDRWFLQPQLSAEDTVLEYGPELGLPLYYQIVNNYVGLPPGYVHHSRIIRLEGEDIPAQQKQMENGWGISVLEPLYDRLLAFDSTTTGIAQLVFKAHLRTLSIQDLRQLIATGGPLAKAVFKQIEMMRVYQSMEGMSVIDKEDTFETHTFTFAGLSDVLVQFAQQLSGAIGVPLVRMLGQSPAGLNSTGESDLRNFYDKIKEKQESDLRSGITTIIGCLYRSELGRPPQEGYTFEFNPLWQIKETEQAEIGKTTADIVTETFEAGLIAKPTALRELRTASKLTGIFTNVTDEDIEQAENEPPPMPAMPGMPGATPQVGTNPQGKPPVALAKPSAAGGVGKTTGTEKADDAAPEANLAQLESGLRRSDLTKLGLSELESMHHNLKGRSLTPGGIEVDNLAHSLAGAKLTPVDDAAPTNNMNLLQRIGKAIKDLFVA